MLTISQWGLICDMAGVVLIFFFALPVFTETGFGPESGGREEQERKDANKKKLFKWLSWIGFGLVIIGFAFQLIGSFASTPIPETFK